MNKQNPSAVSADATVLACGAWLKNSACLSWRHQTLWSAVHGDLGDPDNCIALENSVASLLAQVSSRIDVVAHDLHPDFFSTQLAVRVADRLGVPAIGVQHHHAHIGAVIAEYGLREPVIGLGTDGVAWGGELLHVDRAEWQRLGHLQTLALPGGDAAAREPWRMAASVLHALGRTAEIVTRFGAAAGSAAAQTVQAMLIRNLNCPQATGAGRWFDAAAGALGISVKQEFEAQAAIALEKLAADYLAAHGEPEQVAAYVIDDSGVLDLRPLFAQLFAMADSGDAREIARGAALFHTTLATALTEWAASAAKRSNVRAIALGGGCFFNRVMTARLRADLEKRDLHVFVPHTVSCGDAGLALGQAWVAAQQWQASQSAAKEASPCV